VPRLLRDLFLCLLLLRPAPRPPLFPYTTLFRSDFALELARPVASVDRVLSRLRIVLLLLCLVGTAIAAALSRAFSRQVVAPVTEDRKSTRLNSSHLGISYAVFCLKKKNQHDSHS